jgi:hypothetical protein
MAKCNNCGYSNAKSGYNCPACGSKVNDGSGAILLIAIIVMIVVIIGLILGPAILIFQSIREKKEVNKKWWLISGVLTSIGIIIVSKYIEWGNDWEWLGLASFYSNIIVLTIAIVFSIVKYKLLLVSLISSSKSKISTKLKTNTEKPYPIDETEERLTERTKKNTKKLIPIAVVCSVLLIGAIYWFFIRIPELPERNIINITTPNTVDEVIEVEKNIVNDKPELNNEGNSMEDELIKEVIYYQINDPDGYSNLRDAPKGEILQRVSEGEQFEVIGEKDGYKKVKLSDGTTGYIHESRVVVVN